MKNKFHAISMCSLMAAFAATSALAAVAKTPAASTCPTDKDGWSYDSDDGVCYYEMPESTPTDPLTIPANLKTFKLRYQDGDGNFTSTLLLHCANLNNTVSVKGNANMAGGGKLEVFNRVNGTGFGFVVPDMYQPALPMFTCSGTDCAVPKKTGLNALKITYTSTEGEIKDFELTVTQEQYDFGPMQVYNIEGIEKTGTLAAMATGMFGVNIAKIPDNIKNVLLIQGDAVEEKVALNNAFKGVPFAVDVDTVYFKRTFTVSGENARSTIMLPFSIRKADITNLLNVYEFNRVENNAMHITKVADDASLAAYTPYMIELAEGATTLEFNGGVTLASSEDVSTDVRNGNWVFRGTLDYKKWKDGDPQLTGCGKDKDKSCAYGYAASGENKGKFVRVGVGAHIYPFRAYLVNEELKMTKLAPANASYVLRPTVDIPDELEIVLDGEDGQTTSIGRFDTRTGEIHINSMKHTYDLKGRRVNGSNNARGAYYGKKVLMK